MFLFCNASRLALRSTQPPTQWLPRAFSPEVKRLGREADQSPPSSVGLNFCYISNNLMKVFRFNFRLMHGLEHIYV
jgi:hypothetical protein